MKYIVYCLIIGGLIAFWLVTRSDRLRNERVLAYQRQKAERKEAEQKEKAAKEAKEKEVEETAARNKAVRLFHTFLEQQEKTLKDMIEEAKAEIGLIGIDKSRLSAAFRAVEQENLQRFERDKKRGRENRRYDRAELVLLILKDPTINKLARKYLGEDFAAVRTDFQSKVNAMIGMHTEERSRLAANRRKYEETVADINEEVDKKNARARNSLEAANRGLTGRLAGLYKDREKVQDEIRRLEHEIRGSRVRAELERARANLASINFAIDNMEQVVALGKANTAHMSATLAETGARKRYDDALASRQDDDNDVHADMRHKGDVFSFAVSIENSTRDRLRDAMQRREEVLSLRVGEAQEKLNRLRKPTSNLDFMSAEAIDKMRKDMEAKASADIMKVFE